MYLLHIYVETLKNFLADFWIRQETKDLGKIEQNNEFSQHLATKLASSEYMSKSRRLSVGKNTNNQFSIFNKILCKLHKKIVSF